MDLLKYDGPFGLSYMILLILTILSFFLWLIFTISILKSIFVGFLVSFLTVTLIDRRLKIKEERERERMEDLALEDLRTVINRHLDHLGNLYIASVSEEPEQPDLYEDLFDEDFIKAVKYLDFSKEYPTYGQDLNWLQFSYNEMRNFQKGIESTIQKYGFAMESKLLSILQSLADSKLVLLIVKLGELNIVRFDKRRGIDRDYNILAGENKEVHLEEHLDNLLSLLNYYEESDFTEVKDLTDLAMWQENVSPHRGSARIEGFL